MVELFPVSKSSRLALISCLKWCSFQVMKKNKHALQKKSQRLCETFDSHVINKSFLRPILKITPEPEVYIKWTSFRFFHLLNTHPVCSLQIQLFLLTPHCQERFTRRNFCDSVTEIPYWWRKICLETCQELWLVNLVVILFYLLFTNERRKTKCHKGQM